jgi:hypothetical protein
LTRLAEISFVDTGALSTRAITGCAVAWLRCLPRPASKPTCLQTYRQCVCRARPGNYMLAGAVLIMFGGYVASVVRNLRTPVALPPPQPTAALPTPSTPTEDSEMGALLPARDCTQWWNQEGMYIVADEGKQSDPSSSGPILLQAAEHAIMPAFHVRTPDRPT